MTAGILPSLLGGMFLFPRFQQLAETCLLCKSASRRSRWEGTRERISHNIFPVRQRVGSQVFSQGQSFSRHPHFKRHTDGAAWDLNGAFFTAPQCVSFRAALPILQVIRMSKMFGPETPTQTHTEKKTHTAQFLDQTYFKTLFFLILMTHFLHWGKKKSSPRLACKIENLYHETSLCFCIRICGHRIRCNVVPVPLEEKQGEDSPLPLSKKL